MSTDATRKEVREFDRRVYEVIRREPGQAVSVEDDILQMLVSGGPRLAAAGRSQELKVAYLARGAALGDAVHVAAPAAARHPRAARMRSIPAFARVAVVVCMLAVLLVGLGLGSAYAQPGNPLYSVKRAVEAANLALVTGDQGKAEAYAAFADRRLEELAQVEKQGMTDWYYPLARDAETGIENTYRYGKRLRGKAAEQQESSAREGATRLGEILPEAVGSMTQAQKASVEGSLERIRTRLRLRKGAPSGPGNNGNQGSPGNQPGGLGTYPGGPGQQPGTQQQQQQQQGQPFGGQQQSPGEP